MSQSSVAEGCGRMMYSCAERRDIGRQGVIVTAENKAGIIQGQRKKKREPKERANERPGSV